MSVFLEEVIDLQWGNYYNLKPPGYVLLIVVMLLILLVGSFVSGSGERGTARSRINTKQLVFSAMAIALGYVTSFIKVVDMPMGGAVTLLSMMFVCLAGYWYGLRTGLLVAIAYGCLQLITDPYIISIPQMFTDYIFAFGALGLSGIFANKKNGLIWGYLTGVTGRFIFSFISGMIFFGSYASVYNMAVPVYSFLYNGAYIGLEALITVVIMSLPPVAKGFASVKRMALES